MSRKDTTQYNIYFLLFSNILFVNRIGAAHEKLLFIKMFVLRIFIQFICWFSFKRKDFQDAMLITNPHYWRKASGRQP